MSYIQHQAMCITSWDNKAITGLKSEVCDLGLITTDIMRSGVNNYETFFIVPCGSNSGRDNAKEHIGKIEEVKLRIDSFYNEFGGDPIDYHISVYGQSQG